MSVIASEMKPQVHTRPLADAVAVAAGDGIGPEITAAVTRVLSVACPDLRLIPVDIGAGAAERGAPGGIDPRAWQVLAEHPVLLKGPMTTPQGGGIKSLNVTLRKTLGLFANLRPAVSLAPFVASPHPEMDVVVVRENEEDLYAGIEHRQTDEVVQCLKLMTRPGCERLVRYAFAWARANGRRQVTCVTKDNIMKATDGLFRRVFDEVAAEYPDLSSEHLIVDIGTARLARIPERFDVVVCPNLYGDILSDVAAELSGSVGLAGSANIGRRASMFEAVHGSAPDIAGRDIANPSGLLNAAVMMLAHLGRDAEAQAIHHAWLKTIEDGIHTADIAGAMTTRRVGTREFAEAVVERLGQAPRQLESRPPRAVALPEEPAPRAPAAKTLDGIDVFLHWDGVDGRRDPKALAETLERALPGSLRLSMISNRGVKVYPGGHPDTWCSDHWRCRVLGDTEAPSARDTAAAVMALVEAGFDVIKTEGLYRFDGERGYSVAQGE